VTGQQQETLQRGELAVLGRIRSASNGTFLCEARLDDSVVQCVYKPVAGEQPLWDFPDGTLAGREYSAFLISDALGWNVVPHTIIRQGPAGLGMVQAWVEQPEDPSGPGLVDLCPADSIPDGYMSVLTAYGYAGEEVTLVHADNAELRRMAVFDVIVNNADRKGGHILAGADGVVYGVDHGISLHIHDKLRTVLWGWAGKPIDDDTVDSLRTLENRLGRKLGSRLRSHITAAEVDALCRRVRALVADPVMPSPGGRRPLPWPAF
jgi:uncharacterized repeat protein (TIGR03843 family)